LKSAIKTGAVILAGGKSSRMGLPKATLPFGPELMLQRVVRLLTPIVQPIVVVAASGQQLPPLSADILLTRDKRQGRGPLEGLLAGLTAIEPLAEAAYVTSCDVPLLAPQFVKGMIAQLGDCDIAVPVEGEFPHPLASVYRTTVQPHVRELLASDRLRPAFLFDLVKTRFVPVEGLQAVDPQLATLRNLNQPADYLAALAEAGFELHPAIAAAFETPRSA
jgi:molybdopterin-guanine dinucleotide biosynthesis protein A